MCSRRSRSGGCENDRLRDLRFVRCPAGLAARGAIRLLADWLDGQTRDSSPSRSGGVGQAWALGLADTAACQRRKWAHSSGTVILVQPARSISTIVEISAMV